MEAMRPSWKLKLPEFSLASLKTHIRSFAVLGIVFLVFPRTFASECFALPSSILRITYGSQGSIEGLSIAVGHGVVRCGSRAT